MGLLSSDYIMSSLTFDETWARTKKAIEESSSEQFWWNIVEDRAGQRLVANMEYQKPARLKRHLLLEINFFQTDQDQIRLELHYNINPMINIKEPEDLLYSARNNIAAACGDGGRFYNSAGVVPPEIVQVQEVAEGGTGMMRGIEIVLLLNACFFTFAAMTGGFAGAVAQVLWLQLLWIPIGIIVMFYKAFSKPFSISRGPNYQQSLLEQVLIGSLALGCGIIVCAIVTPIILFGLCIGTVMLYSSGGR